MKCIIVAILAILGVSHATAAQDTVYIYFDHDWPCNRFYSEKGRPSDSNPDSLTAQLLYIQAVAFGDSCIKAEEFLFSYREVPKKYLEYGIGEELRVLTKPKDFLDNLHILTAQWFQQTPIGNIQALFQPTEKTKTTVFMIDPLFFTKDTIRLIQVSFYYSADE